MPVPDTEAPRQVAKESGETGPVRRPGDRRAGEDPAVESEEPRGIERGIADADKEARSGSKQEPVRNTPPAGAWNDTASD